MVLNQYREQADSILLPMAKRITRVSPNTITHISLILALVSGICYALTDRSDDYLILALIALFLSSLFDALDGMVARLTNTSSVRGDLLDHVIDRYSDIFILGGITFSPYCPKEIGFIAIISVLMLSYMGTQAQAVGGKRHYGGWLGRADRMMMLIVVTLLQILLITSTSTHEVSNFYPLGWLMLLFILIGNLNAMQRFYDTWTGLEEAEGEGVREDEEIIMAQPVEMKVKPSIELDDDIDWKGE